MATMGKCDISTTITNIKSAKKEEVMIVAVRWGTLAVSATLS